MGTAKALAVIALPLGLLLAVLVIALIDARRKGCPQAGRLVTFAIVLLWLGGTPAVSARLGRWAESGFPALAVADAGPAGAIVVLGGGVAVPGISHTAALGPEAGRAWAAAQLFRAGKAPLVVVSGGGDPPEAELIADLLHDWLVPPHAVLVDSVSRNTAQNARETRRILRDRDIEDILLVTSALHMPRAAGTFRATGFRVTPFPAGFIAPSQVAPASPAWIGWLPTAGGLADTGAVLTEVLGRIYYRVRGWD